MDVPRASVVQLNRVVSACLDGTRSKGHTCNFSPLKDSFDLLPAQNPLQSRGTKIELRSLKAIFFVKDHAGNPDYKAEVAGEMPKRGRKIEVEFSDGEKLRGMTEAYNPQKPAFFIFPADEKDNNLRIFVITKNVRQVRFL